MATDTATSRDAAFTPVAFPERAFRRWLRRRQECDGDRLDEVWNGVYVVMPSASLDHQELSGKLTAAFLLALAHDEGASVYPCVNVSNDPDDWTKNYRIPDVAVYLPGNLAEDRETHWLGGPDFAVEIVSRGDRSRQKFDFYAGVGVREMLYVERRPWALELYRRDDREWTLVGRSDPESSASLESLVIPVTLRLLAAEPRPRIEVRGRDGGGPWLA